MLGLLDKLHFGHIVSQTVQRIFLSQPQPNVFDELRRGVVGMPPRELERIRRVEQLDGSRLDVTHPPTSYRIAFLRDRAVLQARVLLSDADNEAIERELKPRQPALQRDLIDTYRRTLYY